MRHVRNFTLLTFLYLIPATDCLNFELRHGVLWSLFVNVVANHLDSTR